MSVLPKACTRDEAAASAHVESMLWPEGRACPPFGDADRARHLAGGMTTPRKKHLHPYAAEVEFRCNSRVANGVNVAERAALALLNVVGEWVLYRDSFGA